MKLSDAQVSVLLRLSSLKRGKPIDLAPRIAFKTARGLDRRGLATLSLEDGRGWVVAITEKGLAELEAIR